MGYLTDKYDVSLLHMRGADGSTDFIDESGKVWTARDNAQIDTAQYKFPSSSGLFDGTNDGISSPDHVDWDFPGNFTVEAYVRMPAVDTRDCIASNTNFSIGDDGWGLTVTDAGVGSLRFSCMFAGAWAVNYSAAHGMSVNTWHHAAVVRNGITITLYVDGTSIGSVADNPVTSITGGNQMLIGEDAGGSYDFAGWIDELRISKGIARWTANFTPPTAPYGFVPRAGMI